MNPTIEAYTVALPWYEREDFQRLWELAHDRGDMPSDYETWHEAAFRVMNAWLAQGRTVQIVTIKPDEFLAWIRARNLPNTAETRLQFVQSKAKRAGSETSSVGVAATPGNVALITA